MLSLLQSFHSFLELLLWTECKLWCYGIFRYVVICMIYLKVVSNKLNYVYNISYCFPANYWYLYDFLHRGNFIFFNISSAMTEMNVSLSSFLLIARLCHKVDIRLYSGREGRLCFCMYSRRQRHQITSTFLWFSHIGVLVAIYRYV